MQDSCCTRRSASEKQTGGATPLRRTFRLLKWLVQRDQAIYLRFCNFCPRENPQKMHHDLVSSRSPISIVGERLEFVGERYQVAKIGAHFPVILDSCDTCDAETLKTKDSRVSCFMPCHAMRPWHGALIHVKVQKTPDPASQRHTPDT